MRTLRPLVTTSLAALLALGAGLAFTAPASAIDANSPVVVVPEDRWGDLEPRGVPGDTTHFTFSSKDGEPDCRSPFWQGIAAAGGYVFTAAGNAVEVWDARQDPGEPTLLQSLCRPLLGSFKKDDTDFFFFKVATVANDPSMIAVAAGSKMGVLVIDNRNPGNGYTIYQDEGSSTVGQDYSTADVIMVRSGNRRILYSRTTRNKVIAYDLDRIAALGTPCLQEDGCVSNVFLGQLDIPAASTFAGAGKYLFTASGNTIRVWDTSTNPGNPTSLGTINTANPLLDLSAWQTGGKTWVVGAGFQATEAFDVSCLSTSCAGKGKLLASPSSNFVTASVDPDSGRPYIYVGSTLTPVGGPQVEYLFDATSWEDLTPQTHPDGYWGWYYPGNPTGFNGMKALAAVVQSGHVYRAAFSFFDIHELVGAGRPPIAAFGWTPAEPYAGDPVTFTDSSTGAPNGWGWNFVGANVNSASVKNPGNIVFSAPTSGTNPNTATLTAFNALGASEPLVKSIPVRDPAPAVGIPIANVASAPVCSVIEFTANATGKPPLTYDWDVIDAQDAPLGLNPANGSTFAWDVPQGLAPGPYRATLTVSGVGSTPEVISTPVTIQALDPLAFGSQPTNGASDFGQVTFSVTDSGATAWTWDFGDGNCPAGFTTTQAGCRTTNPNLGRNPTHQYIVGDTTYDVTVTIENCRDGSLTSAVLEVAVGPVQQLIPKFSAQGICFGILGCVADVNQAITFNNETTGFPEKYEMDWNGNGNFVEVTPVDGKFTHAYTSQSPGSGYRPVLRTTRASQVKTFQHQSIIVETGEPQPQPSVSVSRNNPSPLVGASVTFTATGRNCTATSWNWSLGGGANVSGGSSGSSVTASYSSAGNRTVRATAQGGTCNGLSGQTTVNVRNETTPPPPGGGGGNNPTARFTYSPSSPEAGKSVSFDASSSSNAVSFQWDFGDGTTATGEKVTHTYSVDGNYVVKLEASRPDPGCSFQVCIGNTQSTLVVTPDGGEPPPPPPTEATNGCDGELADDPGTVCLLEGRFQVQVDWTNQHNDNEEGIGQGELYTGSHRTGLFWFFNPQNIELIVKMIDATEVDGKIWFFYGALSDVEYTIRVLDTASGAEKTYSNQAGAICGLGDTGAFQSAVPPSSSGGSLPPTTALGAGFSSGLSAVYEANHGPLPHDDEEPTGGGEEEPEVEEGVLPLMSGRFLVSVDFNNQYADDAPGVGTPIVGTNRSGYFWFFRPDNLELVVKMIDATNVTGNFWVFWGGLSDVKYNITIEDTATGQEWTYSNPAGSICGGADLKAFDDIPL